MNDQLLYETHRTVQEVKAVLVGIDGDNGLCGDVRRMTQRLEKLENGHNRLRLTVYILIGVLVGSGIISGAVLGVGS